MIAPRVPANEQARLSALRELKILDTDPEAGFDDLTQLASYVCDTPISLVSLVDGERQWFKSKIGMSASETARGVAFCAHAINDDNLFIVRDALQDKRFADNPLVLLEPHVRFYAGAPLINTQGLALGTLCVIDRVPRDLTEGQKEALAALGRQVVAQLELRKNLADLRVAIGRIKTLEGLLPICAWCKRVRDDNGRWNQIEVYVSQRSHADFTHGICPDCAVTIREKNLKM